MDKEIGEGIKRALKKMQDNRQHWRREINKPPEDNFAKQLKRMRFKRQLLTDNPNATPEDWEALGSEYEEQGFRANAASCKKRGERLGDLGSNGP
jgi:t-SNARE complex subunit (syntaxin)